MASFLPILKVRYLKIEEAPKMEIYEVLDRVGMFGIEVGAFYTRDDINNLFLAGPFNLFVEYPPEKRK